MNNASYEEESSWDRVTEEYNIDGNLKESFLRNIEMKGYSKYSQIEHLEYFAWKFKKDVH